MTTTWQWYRDRFIPIDDREAMIRLYGEKAARMTTDTYARIVELCTIRDALVAQKTYDINGQPEYPRAFRRVDEMLTAAIEQWMEEQNDVSGL
jgi:hypothetical protein